MPFQETSEGQTHVVCSNRLKEEGGKAKCCECHPHEGCNLGISEILDAVKKDHPFLYEVFSFEARLRIRISSWLYNLAKKIDI